MTKRSLSLTGLVCLDMMFCMTYLRKIDLCQVSSREEIRRIYVPRTVMTARKILAEGVQRPRKSKGTGKERDNKKSGDYSELSGKWT